MKQLFISALLVISVISIVKAQNRCVVSGQIEGILSGRLYLIAQTGEQKIDTLGTTLFESSHFRLEGELAEPIVAQIIVEGYQGSFTFLAEPETSYEALLKNGDGAYIRGGMLQDTWESQVKRYDSLQTQLNNYKNRYEKLRRENKFRSASRVNDTIVQLEESLNNEMNTFLLQQDNLISAYVIQTRALSKNADLNESVRMYEALGAGAKSTPSARIMKERIDRMTKTAAGRMAPDFTLLDLAGRNITLSKITGKIKILDFWASWCRPCRLNNPVLKKLYAIYHDKGLEIIGVSLDDKKERWEEAVDKDELSWINVSSLKGWKCDVAHKYNITTVPAVFILDEKNQIIAKDLRGEKLEQFLQERLMQP